MRALFLTLPALGLLSCGPGKATSQEIQDFCTRAAQVNADMLQKTQGCLSPEQVSTFTSDHCLEEGKKCTSAELEAERSRLDCYAALPTCNPADREGYVAQALHCAAPPSRSASCTPI